MRKPPFRATIAALIVTGALAGCPWSNSPDVFDGAKGISMPNFSGIPPQSEPPLAEDDAVPLRRSTAEEDAF